MTADRFAALLGARRGGGDDNPARDALPDHRARIFEAALARFELAAGLTAHPELRRGDPVGEHPGRIRFLPLARIGGRLLIVGFAVDAAQAQAHLEDAHINGYQAEAVVDLASPHGPQRCVCLTELSDHGEVTFAPDPALGLDDQPQ